VSADFSAVPVDLPDLGHAPAEAILAYAIGRFSPRISVACSMQDAVSAWPGPAGSTGSGTRCAGRCPV